MVTADGFKGEFYVSDTPSTRLRVLLICAVNGQGGPIQSMKSIVTELTGSTDFLVATQVLDEPDLTNLPALSGNVIPIVRPKGLSLFRATGQLLRQVRRIKRDVDVIHANGLTELALALPLAIVARKRIVLWIHNFETPVIVRWLRPLIVASRSRIDAFGVSPLAVRLMPELQGTVLANPVGSSVVATERIRSTRLRVGFVAGSDRYAKGFDLLPEIISESVIDMFEWRIHTSPPYSSQHPACLKAWDRLKDLERQDVRILRREQNVRDAFAEIDLVIAPSRRESFNRVIAEAMANGIPVVASAIEPHRELLSTGGGSTYPVEDYEAAVAQLEKYASNPDLRSIVGARGVSTVEQFAPNLVASRLAEAWRAASI